MCRLKVRIPQCVVISSLMWPDASVQRPFIAEDFWARLPGTASHSRDGSSATSPSTAVFQPALKAATSASGHDANGVLRPMRTSGEGASRTHEHCRSEEHTSELQSHSDLVCRL